MRFEISEQDILNSHSFYYVDNKQIILSILKQRGAPIQGTIYFSVIPGYSVQKEHDYINHKIIYTFEKEIS